MGSLVSERTRGLGRSEGTVPGGAVAANLRPSGWWLLAILALGLALRLGGLDSPLDLDEYGPLYAIADRHLAAPDATPPPSDPLVPVSSWREVRERSVFPYGIVNPIPLYHYFLFFLTRVLGPAAWSLRLPSLLAGLGCVVGVFFLCRPLAGEGAALLAALLAAVEPMQLETSMQARPYALGCLACVLSFLALKSLLQARRFWAEALAASGYALAVTFIGYLNPVLLLVGAAHGAWAAWVLGNRLRRGRGNGPAVLRKAVCCLAGVAAAGLLLAPEVAYLRELRQFYHRHLDYLRLFGAPSLDGVVRLNRPLWQSLLAILAVGLVVLLVRARRAGAASAAGLSAAAAPSRALVWLGVSWLCLPQVLAVLSFALTGQAMFLPRYLAYSLFGGILLLADFVMRRRSRAARVGLAALAVGMTFLAGFRVRLDGGFPLKRGGDFRWGEMAGRLDTLETAGLWKEGDVVLFRAGFLEADFFPDEVPAGGHSHVERLITAPLTTMDVPRTPRPVLPLSLSQCGGGVHAVFGKGYTQHDRFYGPELAARLRGYRRFWWSGHGWDGRQYLACLLPWMAEALGSDLRISGRGLTSDSFLVPVGSTPAECLAGLRDRPLSELTGLLLIERR